MRRFAPLVALLLSAVFPLLASAGWPVDAVKLSPSMDPTIYHWVVAAAPDETGGATVIWVRQVYSGELARWTYSLGSQHVDRDGARLPGWPADELIATRWNLDGTTPVFEVGVLGAHPDGVGGAYLVTREVAWNDVGEFYFLQAYRLRRDGVSVALGPAGAGLFPTSAAATAADGAGGLVVAYYDDIYTSYDDPPPSYRVLAQRVDSAGVARWPQRQLVGAIAGKGMAVCGDGSGGGFFAWSGWDNTIHVLHVLADGTLADGWPEQGVCTDASAGGRLRPFIASDGAAGVYVVWLDDREATRSVFATHVLASGVTAPGVPPGGARVGSAGISTGFYSFSDDGLGGAYVVRRDVTNTWPDNVRVTLHRLGADAGRWTGWPVDGLTVIVGSPPVAPLVHDGSGGALIAMRLAAGTFAGNPVSVFRALPEGTLATTWGITGLHVTESSGYTEPIAMVRADGGAIVAWTDLRTGVPAVFAHRVGPVASVPVTVALVSATAAADRVVLRWSFHDGSGRVEAVERSERGGPWVMLTAPEEGGDLVTFVDADVRGGERYGYRLRWSEDGVVRTGGEVWVEVPTAAVLSLSAPAPNPARDVSALTFSLSRRGHVELAVYDIGGRRVRTVSSGDLDAGAHTRHWDLRDAAGHPVGAGLYVARLEAEGRRLAERILVVR